MKTIRAIAGRWGLPLALGVGIIAAGAFLATETFSRSDHESHAHMAMLERSVLAVAATVPIEVPPLTTAAGARFDAAALRGHWSLVFFGFTSCPDVCPMTLQRLAAFARDPASGVASGGTQVVFVSVDPERDTPQRIAAYLGAFDSRFVGVTGSAPALERFTAAAGAGYARRGDSMDHSTSVFVVDPQGRLAGVLLHPSDPAAIRADLDSLRG